VATTLVPEPVTSQHPVEPIGQMLVVSLQLIAPQTLKKYWTCQYSESTA